MPQLGELTRPIMRRCTCLDPDQTARQLGKIRQYLPAPQRTAYHRRPRRIDRMHLEYLLSQIQPDRCNLLHGWLPSVGVAENQLWHNRCRERAIHPIKPGQDGVIEAGRATDREIYV